MVFIESAAFTRRLRELARDAADDVLRGIQGDLIDEPTRGRLVRGLSGIRKDRFRNPSRGKGKRGGYRYFHLYLARVQHIHLLLMLDKDEQEDLSAEERAALRAGVKAIKQQVEEG